MVMARGRRPDPIIAFGQEIFVSPRGSRKVVAIDVNGDASCTSCLINGTEIKVECFRSQMRKIPSVG